MMADKVFLDTNILLRATVQQFPQHPEAASLVKAKLDAGCELWISRQVVREYIAQVTRPQVFMSPMPMDEVEPQTARMAATFMIADETEAVTRQLLALLRAYPTGGRQVHDANIVATMLVNGISSLITVNVEDMRRFADKITILPLEIA